MRGTRVRVSVGEAAAVDRESALAVTLTQCVPRGDRMDFIVQKATELGVARIVPVLSRRSVVRLDERQAASKAAHWRAVAVGACEQSGATVCHRWMHRGRCWIISAGPPAAARVWCSSRNPAHLPRLRPARTPGADRRHGGDRHRAGGRVRRR